LNPFETSK
jgi:hypothetical protein